MKRLKIGDVARLSGAAVETIRYYEREGLLREPDRLPSGYRLYDESTVERLEYIRLAKSLGFTLSEIRELLELSRRSNGCCEPIRERVRLKLVDIEAKIRGLRSMEQSLEAILASCTDADECCPLVHVSTATPEKGHASPLPSRTP